MPPHISKHKSQPIFTLVLTCETLAIVGTIQQYLDKQVEEYLLTPLQNTLLLPHFCALADKFTIHRVTNQAVYHGAADQSERITAACAPEKVETMFDTIKKVYPGLADTLGNSWQVLKKTDSEFVDVVWDPPHRTNLAIEDVFEAKMGSQRNL